MNQLSFHQEFSVSLNRLFNCFCKTELLVQWFMPEDMQLKYMVMNVREGAEFEMVFIDDSGAPIRRYTGEFAKVRANEQLLFTLKLDDGYESSVDVRFEMINDKVTCLHLNHEGLEGEAQRAFAHAQWVARFKRLAMLRELKELGQ
ncbi:SRPBCC family protein [Alteromonas lipotrueiana]|uniref:SRPBCC family protein n=1 Tax=Alteromonas lipotrueiana TaxID=2803815 RepID=UPI001C48E952|nr:SRPBCC domain-containing protein [Alteromonas lipotrueiana]|tara:strand:+ start:64 stop:501 length:438 start_codon:yes stop_codon:yes gene_type:complete